MPVVGRDIITSGRLEAGGRFLIAIGASDERLEGRFVTALAGLDGKLLPPRFIACVGLAHVGIAARGQEHDHRHMVRPQPVE